MMHRVVGYILLKLLGIYLFTCALEGHIINIFKFKIQKTNPGDKYSTNSS